MSVGIESLAVSLTSGFGSSVCVLLPIVSYGLTPTGIIGMAYMISFIITFCMGFVYIDLPEDQTPWYVGPVYTIVLLLGVFLMFLLLLKNILL
jgi:hypothetical protein